MHAYAQEIAATKSRVSVLPGLGLIRGSSTIHEMTPYAMSPAAAHPTIGASSDDDATRIQAGLSMSRKTTSVSANHTYGARRIDAPTRSATCP